MNAHAPPRGLSVWRNPVHWLAFGFGTGLMPRAPGTFGALAAVPLVLLLAQWPVWIYVCVTAALFAAGVWLCGRTARDAGVHDHPGIVWDEIVGMVATMTAAPPGWPWLVAGFALFRLFDIWKPWPIGWLDRHVHGGLGIMGDDLAAGALACLSVQAAAAFL
jgi:phosphatidylglycerophosphatase A